MLGAWSVRFVSWADLVDCRCVLSFVPRVVLVLCSSALPGVRSFLRVTQKYPRIVGVSCLLCSSAVPGVWSFLRVTQKYPRNLCRRGPIALASSYSSALPCFKSSGTNGCGDLCHSARWDDSLAVLCLARPHGVIPLVCFHIRDEIRHGISDTPQSIPTALPRVDPQTRLQNRHCCACFTYTGHFQGTLMPFVPSWRPKISQKSA